MKNKDIWVVVAVLFAIPPVALLVVPVGPEGITGFSELASGNQVILNLMFVPTVLSVFAFVKAFKA